MFAPYFWIYALAPNPVDHSIVAYLKDIATKDQCLAIVGAGIGLLQIIFAFVFIKSMYRKEIVTNKKGGKNQPSKNAKGRK